ncbi:MAG: IS3 family transposase [Culicoidibacterales bacterium]
METFPEYYNTERISVKLKGPTPVQYRNQSLLKILYCPNNWVIRLLTWSLLALDN